KHRMTSITNEDNLSFRQAVKWVPFHLCIHFHLGTLPNRKVSVDADGQSRQKEPYRNSYIIRAWTLGWKPWRMSARSLCDAGKFQSERRDHCKKLDYFVCQDETYLQSLCRRPWSDASQAVGEGRYNSGSLP